jgi:hypothetical protein
MQMEEKIESFHIVPLPEQESLEAAVREEVGPLTDSGPTRAGQILGQKLLKHPTGRFLWLIPFETIGGTWHEDRIEAARARLETMAIIYHRRPLLVLHGDALAPDGGGGERARFPIGGESATLRIYRLRPAQQHNPEGFEQEMVDRVMAAVQLHPANRVGHSTDAQMLLKEEGLGAGSHYQWWISRVVHPSFADRDTFADDVDGALSALKDLGAILGFEDYEVLI